MADGTSDPSEVKTVRDLSKNQRTIYKYGSDAYDKGNYAYCVEMYRRVLKKEPMVMEVREKLLDAQIKAVKGNPGFLKSMWANILASTLTMWTAKLASDGKHNEAMDLGVYCMTIDPTSAAAAQLLARAAENAGLYPITKMVLEFAYERNRKNANLIEYLAFTYAQNNEGKNSLRMYQILSSLQPNREVWKDKVKEASALASMEEGNLIEAEQGNATVKDMIRDKEAAAALEQEGRTQATDQGRKQLIDNQIALLETQDTTANRQKLAELYEADGQFDQAIEWFNKSIELSGVEDPAVRQAITRMEVKKVEGQIAEVRAYVADGTLDQATGDEQINELEWQIHDIKKIGAENLLKKFPNNHDKRFELAELLVAEEQFDEALPHFQKIQSNPRYRIRACMFVGDCFQGKGVFDLAIDQYKVVVDEVHLMDDNKKEAFYQLGQCYLKLDNKDDAIKCFKEIYQVDVNYKDVQQLVLS